MGKIHSRLGVIVGCDNDNIKLQEGVVEGRMRCDCNPGKVSDQTLRGEKKQKEKSSDWWRNPRYFLISTPKGSIQEGQPSSATNGSAFIGQLWIKLGWRGKERTLTQLDLSSYLVVTSNYYLYP